MTLSVQDYSKHYGFTVTEAVSDEAYETLQREARTSPFPARRKELQYRAWLAAVERELSADRISLPIKLEKAYVADSFLRGDVSRPAYDLDGAPGLHCGGLEEAIWSYRRVEYKWGQDLAAEKRVYVGPLPEWVQAKYLAARKHFKPHTLLIVSRHAPFFVTVKRSVQPIWRLTGSPLLVAFAPQGEQLLLAAWGLEYEMPNG